MESLIDEETKLSLKLKRLLDQYDLSDMDEIEDYEPLVNASVERF